jgi:hypothetical protein
VPPRNRLHRVAPSRITDPHPPPLDAPDRGAHIAAMAETDPDTRARQRRRRSRLLNHYLAYFAVLVFLVPVNYLTTPQTPWFFAVMVGWGAPLAIHTAVVLDLFGRRPGE